MTLSLGPLTLDLQAGQARGPAGSHPLTPLESKLLQRLVDARGATVERGQLLTEVWGYRASMVTRTVDVAVARLRSKIEPEPAEPRWLRSERGVGYRLVMDEVPTAVVPAPPPPVDHRVIGREAEITRILAALGEGPVQIAGLPGMGASTVARAVAARWPWECAWIDLRDAGDVVGRVAEWLGCGVDPVNVRGRLSAFAGLVVFDGARVALPFSLGAGRLIVGGPPRDDVTVVTLGPLPDADAVALLTHAARRPIAPEEAPAMSALAARARGIPGTLALFARELRFQGADALLATQADGVDPLAPAWEAARARLSPGARAALDALGCFVVDFSFPAAVAVVRAEVEGDAGERIEELVGAGWVSTAWKGAGEVRFRLMAPRSGTPAAPPSLGQWLAGLRPPQLEREAELALRWAGAADPADPSLPIVLAGLHTVVRKRGGWGPYGAALARLGTLDAPLRYAAGEARWHAADPTGAIVDLDAAIAASAPEAPVVHEMRALCAFYRSRNGDRPGARALLDAIPSDGSRGALEGTFISALLDSEDGADESGALARLRAALTAAERTGETRLIARARHYLATGLLHREDPSALTHFDRAIEGFLSIEAGASAALAAGVSAWSILELEGPDAAIVRVDRAIAALDLGGLRLSADVCRRHRSAFDIARGDRAGARRTLERLLAGADEEPMVRAMLVWLEVQDGATGEAARHAEVARHTPCGFEEEQAIVDAWLHAAGLGPAPAARRVASPEVRLVGRLGVIGGHG